MKHQISKLALIVTLVFIGVGFSGTPQAKAEDCPPINCGKKDVKVTPSGTCTTEPPELITICSECSGCDKARYLRKRDRVTCTGQVIVTYTNAQSGGAVTTRIPPGSSYYMDAQDTTQNRKIALPCGANELSGEPGG